MAKGKVNGVLYCVCNKAGIEQCKVCIKGKRIKPNHTMNCTTWPKKN